MSTVFSHLIDSIMPNSVKEGKVYKAFLDEASTLMQQALFEELKDCEVDDVEGIKSNCIYDFYKKLTEKPEEDFIQEYSDQLKEIEIKQVEIPQYKIINLAANSKGKAISGEKVINPSSGIKVGFGGRAFKRLLKEGLINQDGTYTEVGQSHYDEMLKKRPQKIVHPTRKNGKINLGGKAYNDFLSKGWIYDAENKEWQEPIEEGSTDSNEIHEKGELEEEVADKESETEEGSEQETSTTSCEDIHEEPPKKDNSKKSKKEEVSPEDQTPVKETVPHPTRKGKTLIRDGRGYKNYISKGWVYNPETQEWTK